METGNIYGQITQIYILRAMNDKAELKSRRRWIYYGLTNRKIDLVRLDGLDLRSSLPFGSTT